MQSQRTKQSIYRTIQIVSLNASSGARYNDNMMIRHHEWTWYNICYYSRENCEAKSIPSIYGAVRMMTCCRSTCDQTENIESGISNMSLQVPKFENETEERPGLASKPRNSIDHGSPRMSIVIWELCLPNRCQWGSKWSETKDFCEIEMTNALCIQFVNLIFIWSHHQSPQVQTTGMIHRLCIARTSNYSLKWQIPRQCVAHIGFIKVLISCFDSTLKSYFYLRIAFSRSTCECSLTLFEPFVCVCVW